MKRMTAFRIADIRMEQEMNTDKEHTGNVGGVLLCAQTGEKRFDLEYPDIKANPYIVRTLDLNTDFEELKNQLNQLVNKFFGN